MITVKKGSNFRTIHFGTINNFAIIKSYFISLPASLSNMVKKAASKIVNNKDFGKRPFFSFHITQDKPDAFALKNAALLFHTKQSGELTCPLIHSAEQCHRRLIQKRADKYLYVLYILFLFLK